MVASNPSRSTARRRRWVRAGAGLRVVVAAALLLFGVTLFLFKSFEAHRAALGRQWSERGRAALAAEQPAKAADALRTALSYAPDDHEDQLLLAQALAGAGETEAATSYFLNLWEAHPGDGFVNLQLARLARQRGVASEAENYYRAAIFGNWEGDGVARRRTVRLELADTLAQRGEVSAARAELLIAAGNAPEQKPIQLAIADRFQAMGDLPDALHLYEAVAARTPHDRATLAKAGRTAFALGDYTEAAKRLTEAVAAPPVGARVGHRDVAVKAEDEALERMAADARRIPELSLSRDLPEEQRTEHLLAASGVAQRGLRRCNATLAHAAASPVPDPMSTSTKASEDLAALRARWAAVRGARARRALAHDGATQDELVLLIHDTEEGTAAVCGPLTGDDALLLPLTSAALAKPEGTPQSINGRSTSGWGGRP